MCKRFLWKLSTWVKVIIKTLDITSDFFFFEATMNPALIGVLYLFGKQYIKGRVLSHSVILRSNFLKYLIV